MPFAWLDDFAMGLRKKIIAEGKRIGDRRRVRVDFRSVTMRTTAASASFERANRASLAIALSSQAREIACHAASCR